MRGTIRLRPRGSNHVASLSTHRSLDNEIARAIVCAEAVLTRHIGNTGWRPPRIAKMLPLLWAAVGTRPMLPSERELQRIRYTPITRPFKAAAELSWRIARSQGYSGDDEGRYAGLLLDVAELWELFVLNTTRLAVPHLTVEHSTFGSTSDFLLTSLRDRERGMGQLKPDVLVRRGDRVVAVLDAKYKRLAWAPDRRHGVDRADLYQLASYIGRYDPDGEAVGMLLYPTDSEQDGRADAEQHGPWEAKSGTRVEFRRLAVTPQEAAEELATLLDRSEQAALRPTWAT
jgi:5-methylcytosine-specific restriction enzyme subunit McrC